MTIRGRLAQLEKRIGPPPETNPYMTMDLQELYARAWQAVQDGETIAPEDTDPRTEELRAEILRRLERIAEAQNDPP
jgi:hypothetical protein